MDLEDPELPGGDFLIVFNKKPMCHPAGLSVSFFLFAGACPTHVPPGRLSQYKWLCAGYAPGPAPGRVRRRGLKTVRSECCTCTSFI